MNLWQKILIVDDECGIREGLHTSLKQLGFEVETAESGEKALYHFRQSHGISHVVTDYKMPGLSGFDVLKEIKRQSPQTKVVLMTAYGSIHHAVDAMQMGADDYLAKPFKIEDLEKIILRSSPPSRVEARESVIFSNDPSLLSLLRKAERGAKTHAPILIEGPSGTGKELLARQIHRWSSRRDKPWVAINCAALPPGLLESELFGYEKGAFTGATERKLGRFEQADGGTLLLDEIGELESSLQAKLLRVLQEAEIDRLGGRKPLRVNVRVIATTNKNLEKKVLQGSFREDLFFRLYGIRFVLPALKDRKADITLLSQHFLDLQSQLQNRSFHFLPEVLPYLESRSWPGNVRELERAIERATIFSESDVIALEHFEFNDQALFSSLSLPVTIPVTLEDQKSLKDREKEIILEVLRAHQGNRTHAARSLGMSLRTFRHKLKLYREAGVFVDLPRQNELGINALSQNKNDPDEGKGPAFSGEFAPFHDG